MTDKQTDTQTDIATYRLNRPKGRFSENVKIAKTLLSNKMSVIPARDSGWGVVRGENDCQMGITAACRSVHDYIDHTLEVNNNMAVGKITTFKETGR